MNKRFEVQRFPGATAGLVVFDTHAGRRVTAKDNPKDAQEMADLLNATWEDLVELAGLDKRGRCRHIAHSDDI